MSNINFPESKIPTALSIEPGSQVNLDESVTERTQCCFDWFKNIFYSRNEAQPLEESRVSLEEDDGMSAICGVIGNGEMFRKVRVTWINGIDHTSEDAIKVASHISKAFGNVNVHYVCNETAGFWSDLAQASMQKIAGRVTPEVKALARHFKTLIQDLGGVDSGGKIIHLAHSQGAIITYLAKNYLTPEERKMIDVKTFGPAQVLTSNDYNSAVNYFSTKDPLLYVNREAITVWRSGKPTQEIRCMEPINSNGYIDHSMDGPTYKSALKMVSDEFKNSYETYTAKMLRWAKDKWNDYRGVDPEIIG